MAYAFIVLSDVSQPSRENFPGDENSNGVPREIPIGEQCSEFKSIEAAERGAYCIGFRKRLEFRTVSWQEETARQVCLYERIPGTPQPAGLMLLALKQLPPYHGFRMPKTAFISILSTAILERN
jgi:hypothetical protein